MLELKTQYQNKATGDNGHGVPVNNDTNFVWTSMQAAFVNIQENTRVELWALNGSACGFHYEIDTEWGDPPEHDVYPNLYPETYYPATDTRFLTATNGGWLLNLANLFKDYFFEGVTQTAASLYAFMVNKYGNHTAFHYQVIMGVGPVLDFDNRHDGDWESVEIQWPKATARGYSGIFPQSWNFAGDYGEFIRGFPEGVEEGDRGDYCAAKLIFGDDRPIENTHLHFDVYINGMDSPTIATRWSAIEVGENFSLQLVQPQIYNRFAQTGQGDSFNDFYVNSDGVRVPMLTHPTSGAEIYRDKSYTWSQTANDQYIGLFNSRYGNLSGLEKVALFGVDGIADAVYLVFRFNYKTYIDNAEKIVWGDAIKLKIPKHRDANNLTDETIQESAYGTSFTTSLTIHYGLPPQDNDDNPPGDDDPDPDPPWEDPEFDPYEPTGYDGNAILTQTYSMPALTLQNVGSKLWSQSYWDVLKIQSNPIENIISCKWYPFSVSGVVREIQVGDIAFGINGEKISSIYTMTVGTYTYTGNECNWTDANTGKIYKIPKFMCCSPYTTVKLHLPYAGTIQIDASDFIGKPLKVKLIIDLITGDMLYLLYMNGAPYMTVAGKIGVDIPLTATNRAQTELASASTQLSAVIGAAGALMGGNVMGAAGAASSIVSAAGMDYTSQRSATHSPACASFENRAIYLEFSFPKFVESEGFRYSHGYPTHKWITLSKCSGFVKVDNIARLDVAMSEEENRMIEELLTEGVYV